MTNIEFDIVYPYLETKFKETHVEFDSDFDYDYFEQFYESYQYYITNIIEQEPFYYLHYNHYNIQYVFIT